MIAGAVRKLWADQRIRFLAVGAFNTGFGYVSFAVLYALFGRMVHYLVLATMAHFLSVSAAFTTHRRLVFGAQAPWFGAFLRYNLTVLGNLAFGLLAMVVLVKGMQFSPFIAQAIIVAVLTVINYFAHKFFTFRHR